MLMDLREKKKTWVRLVDLREKKKRLAGG